MKNFTFSFPTQVIFGRDAETHAGALSAPFGPNVMLLYGSDRIRRSGLLGRLTADLEAHGLTVTLFGGIQENPALSTAEEGRRLAKEKKITLLLAVGGGSVIDTAKAISLGAKNSVPLWELYSGKAQTQRALPIGVVLTTAATASEANGVSVLCHDVLHEKAALDEPLTRPRFALMNPVLTYTLPPRQTASCAVDIFSHAFERYFHKGQQGTLRSQMCAAVMRTVITELPRALAHPDSYDARSQLMWASTVAHSNMLGFEGDFACHALSHVFTTELGLPHGAALGILMTAWCKYMLTDETEAPTSAPWFGRSPPVPARFKPPKTASPRFRTSSARQAFRLHFGRLVCATFPLSTWRGWLCPIWQERWAATSGPWTTAR